jgi:1,4-dihydroxy-6-naphthoate synthase
VSIATTAPSVLRLGFSPCPNDCFVFHALLHGRALTDLRFDVTLADVEQLNGLAADERLDVAKISYHAAAFLTARWSLLPSGGALGRGVGPLVVTRVRLSDLAGARVAIPGGRTTASLLLRLAAPAARTVVMRYDRIMPAVAAGEVDAGVIIHESRFTYADHGLLAHADLGAWWEATTGEPIPLGAVAVRRALPSGVQHEVARAVHASVAAGLVDPRASAEYVARHAQELEPSVRARHIDLYVNDATLDVGAGGRRAAATLLAAARSVHGLPEPDADPFLDWHPPPAAP